MKKLKQEKNKLLNQLVIDVPNGSRTFFLHYGDLLLDDSEMWLVAVYDDENGEPYGDFKNALTECFQLKEWQERKILLLDNGGWIGRLVVEDENMPIILLIHMIDSHRQTLSLEDYEQYVRGAFSAIAALEFQGVEAKSLALPVLFRKGLNHLYNEATEILIKYATRYLRTTSLGETIRYYVYHKEDALIWNDALDRVLGRVYVDSAKEGIIESLRQEILTVIDLYPKDHSMWEHTLVPLKNSLTMANGIVPEKVGTFSRKAAEVISEDLCMREGITLENSFFVNLRNLGNHNVLIQWMVQYLYMLRAFGNTSVHPAIKPKIGPKSIQHEDLVVMLSTLLRVLKFYKFYIYSKK